MPGRRVVVNGRLVNEGVGAGISWFRALLLGVVLLILVATNPIHEATTSRLLSEWKLDEPLYKLTGFQLSFSYSSSTNSSYWKRRTTNYIVAAVKERMNGIEVGALQRSITLCTFNDADWGSLCRAAKTWLSHPGVEWWRLPTDEPPLVVHRVLVWWLLGVTGLAACRILQPGHNYHLQDPLLSMFLPPTTTTTTNGTALMATTTTSVMKLVGWLLQCLADANVLLYPVWERLYQLTLAQAVTSPCRVAGSKDAWNFYAAVLVLAVVAAGVRLLSGHSRNNNNIHVVVQGNNTAWLVFLLTTFGYWRGTFARQQEQPSFWSMMVVDDSSDAAAETNNLVMLFCLRMAWFVLSNGLVQAFDNIFTWSCALLCGAALGDYHYSHQVWEVWSQSWTKFMDDAWAQLFGRSPRGYQRAYDY